MPASLTSHETPRNRHRVVGVVWQLSIFATPIYLVTRNWPSFGLSLTVFAITLTFLKFNWYDKLENNPVAPASDYERPDLAS